jgi:hypothetical protein
MNLTQYHQATSFLWKSLMKKFGAITRSGYFSEAFLCKKKIFQKGKYMQSKLGSKRAPCNTGNTSNFGFLSVKIIIFAIQQDTSL